MSLASEIFPYIDGNNLIVPNLVPPGTVRGSDNGVMFTSELFILLKYNNEQFDKEDYAARIQHCIGLDNELHRAPSDTSPDEVDDHYGAYAAHYQLGVRPAFKLPFRLWRQPQLLLASIVARYGRIPFWARPLVPLAAIIIATSCMFAASSDTDSRRLSWLLIQTLSPTSWLCRHASQLWYKRLHKTYGSDGMKVIARLYYRDDHPFQRYWVD